MKKLFSVSLFLFLCLVFKAQSPQFSIHAHGGTWRPWVRNETAYAIDTQRWQAQAAIGFGISLPMAKPLLFSPELGLEYRGLDQVYGSSRDPRHIIAKLGLFYGRISPGITVLPFKHFSIRAGWGMLVSASTVGEYSIWYVDHDLNQVVTIDYTDHFSRIRNPFLFGPELSLGVNITKKNRSFLSVCLSGFLTKGSVFRPSFNTLFNPRIAQVNLGMAYTFPSKTP